jgi:hypothetical protein
MTQMKIGELTQRLGVPYRTARYVLEQEHVPAGTELNPGRGAHRQLEPKQTFWLALVLILKQNGLRLPLAAQIAEDLRLSMRMFTGNLNWDGGFHPFLGRFETEFEWYTDIAEMKYVRVVTSAYPSSRKLQEMPWTQIGTRKSIPIQPFMFLRIDLSKLAKALN